MVESLILLLVLVARAGTISIERIVTCSSCWDISIERIGDRWSLMITQILHIDIEV